MLALNDTQKLEAWHEQGLLDPALQPAHRPGVKSLLKQFSYMPVKPGRSRSLFLNHKVNFPGTQVKIACRHLAVHWLLHRPLLENGKIDYAAFRSKKRLHKAFRGENERAFEYYFDNCTNTHLVENNRWGKFLAKQFQEMEQVGKYTDPKRMLICSENHAMACELKIKIGADGHPSYVVRFYDPNHTASHRRVRTPDLANIASLSMAKLINDRSRSNRYYKNQKLSLALIIPDEMPRPTHADRLPRARENIANRQLSSRPATRRTAGAGMSENAWNDRLIDANYVYQIVRSGFSGELADMFEKLSNMSDTDRQVNALMARSSCDGSTALIGVMILNFTNTVSNYTRGVLTLASLSGEQKASILSQSAKMVSGKNVTGLQAALMANSAPVVYAFTQLILASEALSPDQKCQVLRTEIDDRSLIQRDPKSGYPRAALAFIDAVKRSSLAPDVRGRLIDGI